MNDIMLLAVDLKDINKKDFYSKELNIQNVKVVHNLVEAKQILSRHINGEIPFSALLINFLLVDQEYSESDLIEISENFQGAIIVKVDNDLDGVNLVKRRIATDFFVSDNNEVNNLKFAFNVAVIRKRCNDRLCEINNKLKITQQLEKQIEGVK